MSGPNDKPQGGGKRGRKVRIDLQKNISNVRRKRNWAEDYQSKHGEETHANESVRAKGSLSRKRTIIEDAPSSDSALWRDGVIVAVRGLVAEVESRVDLSAGERPASVDRRRCTIRRVLRNRLMAERGPMAVGDRVRYLPLNVHATDEAHAAANIEAEGVIEEVLPRTTTLKRQYGERVQIIAANIDNAIIVTAAIDPPLRPHLIDRFIVAAHKGDLRPVVCINKIDTITHADAMEIILEVAGRYRDLGYEVLLTSATSGEGIDELRAVMRGKSNVVAGVSGVGKSSLLNAVQPGLKLRIGDLGEASRRGQHTTTTAELLRLEFGGYVVDTPGVRQFELAHIDAGELEAYFIEFIEPVANCKFSDCHHIHEDGCAVRAAVDAGKIHPERYDSYKRMFTQRMGGEEEEWPE